ATGIGVLDLANALHLSAETEFAHPDFNVRPQLNSYKWYDYYADEQEHIETVVGPFNGPTVWDFAGLTDTVMLAIVDDGITDHEDLPRARIEENGWRGRFPAKRPGCWPSSAHGMGCAGIIAASHTTDSSLAGDPATGVISLNPHTRLINIQLFDPLGYGGQVSDMAAGISYAWRQGAAVMNNSWSFFPGVLGFPEIDLALDSAYERGRNGKGCVLVFSTGNDGPTYPGFVNYPARHDRTLAVGAVDKYGGHLYYSQWGPELDVVAPSGMTCFLGDVWTLDQMYYSGYNPNLVEFPGCPPPITWDCIGEGEGNNMNYDCHFGGTSAAAPIVTGIASLLISRDSNLTAPEIYDIIRHSADPHVNLLGEPINPPDSMYAYGRADAFRAILSIARGDTDNSGWIDITDVNRLVDHLFLSLEPLFPTNRLGDCSCDGIIDVTDLN
ncbi:MAG: S8 family serine peptidase, partial [FCB group bacterium]|nr:S8 family serine peptidase [FCB group bacterium]